MTTNTYTHADKFTLPCTVTSFVMLSNALVVCLCVRINVRKPNPKAKRRREKKVILMYSVKAIYTAVVPPTP